MLEKAQHGKRGTYTRGCRCVLCRFANTAYVKSRRILRPSRFTSAESTRNALKALREDKKVSVRELAKVSGIPVKTLYHIISSKHQRIWASTAKAIAEAVLLFNTKKEEKESQHG